MKANAHRTIGQVPSARFALVTLASNLLLLTLPAVVQAQFNYTTNNDTITITGYTGPGGAVAIPADIDGLPVTRIADYAFDGKGAVNSLTIPNSVTEVGDYAFLNCSNLSCVILGSSVSSLGVAAFGGCSSLWNVCLPNTVTTIGGGAFLFCISLTNIFIPNSVTSIGNWAFQDCTGLTSITIPDGVVGIGGGAFDGCTSLTNVTIGKSVTSIGSWAFDHGYFSTRRIYFRGNAPSIGSLVFGNNPLTTIYYLPGTTGWGPYFGDEPTARWSLPNPTILTFLPYFGVQTNQFGFRVSWATNSHVVVEACTSLGSPNWTPLATNIPNPFSPTGWFYFSDPEWTNHPARFYRLRSP